MPSPELAYSWRHTMRLGWLLRRCIDQRGYGRTYSPSGLVDHLTPVS
jgi:hypothetical protein